MLHRATRYVLAFGLLASPAAASAQAFGLNEIGACALARGFAATASPCEDASSIYWNPAKHPATRGLSFYGGAALIALKGDFIQDTTGRTFDADLDPAIVPNICFNYRGAGRMSYGLGVYVPYGLTSQWADDFPGRFAAKRASLATIYIQPNLSYQVSDRWSVGGGPVIGHSKVELIQALDLAAVPTPAGPTFGQLGVPKRTEFARATLDGSANAVGAGFTAATAAAPPETVTPLLPDQDRALAMFGAGVPVGRRFVVDASYARVFTPGRRGRLDERSETTGIGFAYYDPNIVFAARRANGTIPPFPNLASGTATFGTLISLDGVHPSGAGHLLVANELVAVINAKYGTTLPPATP